MIEVIVLTLIIGYGLNILSYLFGDLLFSSKLIYNIKHRVYFVFKLLELSIIPFYSSAILMRYFILYYFIFNFIKSREVREKVVLKILLKELT